MNWKVKLQIEHMLEFLHSEEKLELEEWIEGDVVQKEILEYLGVPLGALLLKHYRTSRGISQKELAKALGTSRQDISKLETGTKQIDRTMCGKIGAFFGVAAEPFLKR